VTCDVRLDKPCLENNGAFFVHVPLIAVRWFIKVRFIISLLFSSETILLQSAFPDTKFYFIYLFLFSSLFYLFFILFYFIYFIFILFYFILFYFILFFRCDCQKTSTQRVSWPPHS